MIKLMDIISEIMTNVSPPAIVQHVPSININKIVNAIYRAEGGNKTKYPYGIKSIKTKGRDDARKICINTVNHAYRDWISAGSKGDFIDFLSKRYCFDEHEHWAKMVKSILKHERSS